MRCVAPPRPKMIGATLAPRVFTRLFVPHAPRVKSTETFRMCSTVATAEISTPLLLTDPRLRKIDVPHPQLGARVTALSASCDKFEKYLNPKRAENVRISASG